MAGDQSPFDRLATEGFVTMADTLVGTRSSFVSTLPRQLGISVVGSIASGTILAARANCAVAGTYSKVRFATGNSAPVLTDCRVGVWNGSNGVLISSSDNVSATVDDANTVYEISLTTPVTLALGDSVFIGLGMIGSPVGTYFGTPGLALINAVDPQLTRMKSSWASGPLDDLSTASSNTIIWAELIP